MSILNLPLAARKEDRTIVEANGSILADVWWHDDAPNNKWNADANARAAEIVRRVNLHDELANALSRLAYALHGKGDRRGVLHDVPAALENADAVLAKLEAR